MSITDPSGGTVLSDVIVPEIFTNYIQQITTEKSAIIQSGAVVESGFINQFLAGAGNTAQIPGFRDLDTGSDDGTDERVTNDASNPDISHKKIQTAQETVVRLSRNNSWSSSDLSSELIGVDPMAAIMNRVGEYWTRRMQRCFISIVRGVFANNDAAPNNAGTEYAGQAIQTSTHTAGDMTFDISGNAYTKGLTTFSAEAFVDATATMGDSQDMLSMVLIHSAVYARMKKANMIDFVPDSEQMIRIPTFLGHRVIVDDLMPNAGGVYDSWLFAPGTFEYGMGTPKTPVEMYRRPDQANGGGEDELYHRLQWCFHPVGYRYVGAHGTQGGPDNTQLRAASSWSRVFTEREMIKIARLRTRES